MSLALTVAPMKFSAFIVANQQGILDEWVRHARTMLPIAQGMSVEELEDHGRQLILAIAADMESPQSEKQRFTKSQYIVAEPDAPLTAAAEHGRSRQLAGFDPMQMHGEFRALRAQHSQVVGSERARRHRRHCGRGDRPVQRIRRSGIG